MPKAIVRQEVEKLSGVSRTWYEYTWENDAWLPILVVEVDFNTDPNAYNDFRPPVLDEISHTVIDTLSTLQGGGKRQVVCSAMMPRLSSPSS
jgi:hypothetical protein